MSARKRKQPDEGTSVKCEDIRKSPSANVDNFMKPVTAFILPAGIERARLEIFKSQLAKYGGKIHDRLETNTTHVIVDDKMSYDRMCKLLNIDHIECNVKAVKSIWLSSSFREKKLLPEGDNELRSPNPLSPAHPKDRNLIANTSSPIFNSDFISPAKDTSMKPDVIPSVLFRIHKKPHSPDESDSGADSEYSASDGEQKSFLGCHSTDTSYFSGTSSKDSTPSASPAKKIAAEKWICAQSSNNTAPNFNKHITDKLEEMVKNYQSTNDRWRVFSYQKAIQTLRKHPKEISSWEEARKLPNIGSRLADKIWEIAESGELRKLSEFQSSEEMKVLKLFTDLWGAGPHTARMWYQQGFRSLEDLKVKAKLTSQQQIGLRLYDDFLDRMPREEAAEVEIVVREAAESLQPGIIAQACGSYRRGKSTCGDVDILITHPDGTSHRGIFSRLIAKLKESEFLTDDLVSVEETGNQKKYMGVCRLPGPNRKHRRLDIIVVPYTEYGCALVYFTGSAHFTRSLRHLCKKLNMSLNEHALKTGVVRKGTEKIHEGTIVTTPTEESIFQILGIPFRPPDERDH